MNVAGASGRGGVGGSDSVSTAAAGPALGSVELPCTEDVRPGSDSSASFSCMVDMGGSVGAGDSSSVTLPDGAGIASEPRGRGSPSLPPISCHNPGAGTEAKAAATRVGVPPGFTAIIVDDERMIRRVVERYLDKMGVEVVASLDDGDLLGDALAHLPSPPSLVLLDIVMKRSNGLSVMQQLRQKHPECASIPVYAMTSNIELVAEYEAAGFAGLVGKPFNRRKLTAAVQHCATGFADASRLTQSGFFVA